MRGAFRTDPGSRAGDRLPTTAIPGDTAIIASHHSGGTTHHLVRSLGAALLRGD